MGNWKGERILIQQGLVPPEQLAFPHTAGPALPIVWVELCMSGRAEQNLTVVFSSTAEHICGLNLVGFSPQKNNSPVGDSLTSSST